MMARPSLLIKGPTGAGKTNSIGALLQAGLRVAVIDIEGRSENIQKHQPLLIMPENVEEISEIIGNAENLKRFPGILRDTKTREAFVQKHSSWQDIDVLAFDSILELAYLTDRRLNAKYPREKATRDSSWARWDEFGWTLVAIAKNIRYLSSAYMDKPLTTISTLGEVEDKDAYGNPTFKPLIRGNIAGPNIPFVFTYIFRQYATEPDEDGRVRWMLQTAGKGLKPPEPGVLPHLAELSKNGFANVYESLMQVAKGS